MHCRLPPIILLRLLTFLGLCCGFMLMPALAAQVTAPTTRPMPDEAARIMEIVDRPGLSADEIMSAINGIRFPRFDRSRDGDPGYEAQHRQDTKSVQRVCAALEFRFVDDFPNDLRAADVLSWAIINHVAGSNEIPSAEAHVALGRAFVESLRPKYGHDPRLAAMLSAMKVWYGVQWGNVSNEEVVAAVDRLRPADPRNSKLAEMLIMAAIRTEGDEKLRLLEKAAKEFPDVTGGKEATGILRRIEGTAQPFRFAFEDVLTGRDVSSDAMEGQIIVVDFWATWCGPCVAETPRMKQAYERFHGKGVEFIGVSLDVAAEQGGREKLISFLRDNDIPWPQSYDGKSWESDLVLTWGVEAIPAVFVIDTDGTLIRRDARENLEQILADLLAQRDAAAKP